MNRNAVPAGRALEGSAGVSGRRGSRGALARRGAVLGVASVVAVLGATPPAAAHVGITPSTTAAGAYAVLEVSVPHGCEGSATTEVAISIPAEINAVTPTRHPLWEVEEQVEALDPPVTDSHGSQITERVSTITYRTDTPLPDGHRDTFQLSLQLPESEGTALVFPIIQTCEQGETAWIEVPEDGQDGHDLARPAATVVVTGAESGGAHGQGGSSTDDADTDVLALGALGVGLLGALLGGAALALQRRRA